VLERKKYILAYWEGGGGEDGVCILKQFIQRLKNLTSAVEGGIRPCWPMESEPIFVNLLRSPGIDSQPSGPERQPYWTYRPGKLQRLAESIPWNRFLDSLYVSKYGLSGAVTSSRLQSSPPIKFFSFETFFLHPIHRNTSGGWWLLDQIF
jgi:hypothetical protein